MVILENAFVVWAILKIIEESVYQKIAKFSQSYFWIV